MEQRVVGDGLRLLEQIAIALDMQLAQEGGRLGLVGIDGHGVRTGAAQHGGFADQRIDRQQVVPAPQ